MRAGVDDYLAKPFDLDELQARLVAAERVTTLHRRREALLRQARRVAAEDDPKRLLRDLLDEAIRLVGGTTGFVARWDDAQGRLVPVWPEDADVDHKLGSAQTISVPLRHEGRLIGTLNVGTRNPDRQFTREDAELLEVLASTSAAALVALERARLEGVLLAARTAQHELNNQLALAKGYAELLVGSPELPPELAEMAEEVMRAADDAARIIRQLRSVSHIHETRWPAPADTTIDLTVSAAKSRPPTRQPVARGHGTRRAFMVPTSPPGGKRARTLSSTEEVPE
jgi:signal transduction histidine kinase